MKKIVITIFIFYLQTGFSNTIKITFSNEKTEFGYKVLVSNDEFCPVSFKIDFELINLKSSNGNNTIFVVPAKTYNYIFTELTIINSGKYGFSYKTLANYGNHYLDKYNADFVYTLPFENGKKTLLYQGYNGKTTHQNENSLDFTMPIDTPILAARDGIVVKVVDHNDITCFEKKCAEYNNYITVFHTDGSFSRYVHIKKNGSLVKEGANIKQNDTIGFSGNVGWSNGPHLHFMVFIQKIDQQITVETKFKINDGTEIKYLKEKETYIRNY